MPHMLLIIKAPTVARALDYARLRGFETTKVLGKHEDVHNVVLEAKGPREDALRWLAEPSTLRTGYGFPDGTLIHYREEDADRTSARHLADQRTDGDGHSYRAIDTLLR